MSSQIPKLLFVGAGKVAQSIIRGIIKARPQAAGQILATAPTSTNLDIVKTFGCKTTLLSNATESVEIFKPDFVFLCIPPQVMGAPASGLHDSTLIELLSLMPSDCTTLSLLPGVRSSTLAGAFNISESRVVRVVLTLAAEIGSSIVLYYSNLDFVTTKVNAMEELLELVGPVVVRLNDENLIDVGAGICSSGMAFSYEMIQTFSEIGDKNRMNRSDTTLIAAQLAKSSGEMVITKQLQPYELRDKVTSKEGTTFYGLTSWRKDSTGLCIQKALQASIDGARQPSTVYPKTNKNFANTYDSKKKETWSFTLSTDGDNSSTNCKIPKLLFVGAGNIAQSMIRGIIKAQPQAAEQIMATAPSYTNLDIVKTLGCKTSLLSDAAESIRIFEPDFVFLCMKPQVLLASISEHDSILIKLLRSILPTCITISLLAGVKSVTFAGAFNIPQQSIVRVMLNTAAELGSSSVLYHAHSDLDMTKAKTMEEFLGLVGPVIRRLNEENLMDVGTGICGSGPAFFYEMMQTFIDVGVVGNGLTSSDATLIAAQLVKSAGEMVLTKKSFPYQLLDEVASPSGTTIDGLNSWHENSINQRIGRAIQASIDRATELSAMISKTNPRDLHH